MSNEAQPSRQGANEMEKENLLAGERRGGVMNDLEVQTASLRAILSPEIEAAWARMRAEDARAEANSVEPEYDTLDERLDQIECMISVADDMLDRQWPPELHEAFLEIEPYLANLGELPDWVIDSFDDAYANAITQRREEEHNEQ